MREDGKREETLGFTQKQTREKLTENREGGLNVVDIGGGSRDEGDVINLRALGEYIYISKIWELTDSHNHPDLSTP